MNLIHLLIQREFRLVQLNFNWLRNPARAAYHLGRRTAFPLDLMTRPVNPKRLLAMAVAWRKRSDRRQHLEHPRLRKGLKAKLALRKQSRALLPRQSPAPLCSRAAAQRRYFLNLSDLAPQLCASNIFLELPRSPGAS